MSPSATSLCPAKALLSEARVFFKLFAVRALCYKRQQGDEVLSVCSMLSASHWAFFSLATGSFKLLNFWYMVPTSFHGQIQALLKCVFKLFRCYCAIKKQKTKLCFVYSTEGWQLRSKNQYKMNYSKQSLDK